MNKDRILFVINPIAGDTNKDTLEVLIKNESHREQWDYEVYKTTGEQDMQAIRERVAEYMPTIVYACGGDGTVNMVAEELLETNCILGILPLGSANGLATELDIPADWKQNLHMIAQCRTKNIDAIRINGRLCLHLADLGFNAELIKEFEQNNVRGMLGYTRSFFKKLMNRSRSKYKLKFKDRVVRYKAEMVVLANASSYGTGAVINPKCNMEDGKFEICVFLPIPWKKLFSVTWHSFMGKLEESEYFKIHRTDNVVIFSKRKRLLQVDGEVLGLTKKVKANALPQAIKLLVQ